MVIIEKLPIQRSYWVIPNRFRAGEHPTIGSVDATKLKLRWLMELGINTLLDLTEIGEADIDYETLILNEASFLNSQVFYKRFAIPDWHTPSQQTMIEILDEIDQNLSEGKNIYLHCYGGKGRTGTVVGCYLVRHGTPVFGVLSKIQELRKEFPENDQISPETDQQRKMVLMWNKGQ
jgi:protein-tyrosine phosphatase